MSDLTVTDTKPVATTTASQGGTLADQARGLLNGSGAGQYVDKARSFAKARPFASAALAGVVGIALLNTLRGR